MFIITFMKIQYNFFTLLHDHSSRKLLHFGHEMVCLLIKLFRLSIPTLINHVNTSLHLNVFFIFVNLWENIKYNVGI